MSIFEKISAGWLSTNNEAIWHGGGFGNLIGGRTSTGHRITAEDCMRLSAYYAAITYRAEDLAKCPMVVYKKNDGDDRERAKDHPAHTLVRNRPNDDMSAMNFWELLYVWAQGWGMGLAQIEFANGWPVSLSPIHPSRVQISRDSANRLVYDVNISDVIAGPYREPEPLGNRFVRLQQYQTLCIHGHGPDGITGYPLSVIAKESVAVGLSAEKFMARFFANDAMPSVLLVHPDKISPEAMANIRSEWMTNYKGVDKSHGVGVLSENIKVERLNINPRDAEMLLERKYTVIEIARWFRMNPTILMAFEGGGMSITRDFDRSYVNHSLQPWAVRAEQEVTHKLLGGIEGDHEHFAEILFDAMLRGNPVERSTVRRTDLLSGQLSVNEARRLEGRNSIGEIGDVYLFPMNMQPLELAVRADGQRRDREPDSGTSTDPNPRDRAIAISIHRPLIADAVGRVVDKDCKALERAALKHKGSPSSFGEWSSEFCERQGRYFESAVGIHAEALALAVDSRAVADISPVINQYLADTKNDMEHAFNQCSVSETCEKWRDHKIDLYVELVVKEVINGI